MRIVAEDVGFVFNEGTPLERGALDSVSFTLDSGEAMGILGGNGSGKTTLIRLLGGLIVPTRGRMEYDGVDGKDLGPGLARGVGVVFQRPERQLFEETVFNDVSFVLRRSGSLDEDEIRRRTLNACRLMGLVDERILDLSPFSLSDAEKRRAAIAGILAGEPETLILDEPTVGLDPPTAYDLLETLREIHAQGVVSIVVASHHMDLFLPMLDTMMVLNNGKQARLGRPIDVCRSMSEDDEMRELTPASALPVLDLEKAGFRVSQTEFDMSALADKIAALIESSGDPQ